MLYRKMQGLLHTIFFLILSQVYILSNCMMFLSSKIVARFSSFNVLRGLQSYKDSAAQRHLHSYVRDQRKFNELKKTIDYQTITKSSKGRIFIREFLFQEKVEQNYIAPLNTYLLPQGKWTKEELKSDKQETRTKTQLQNDEIISSCSADFQAIFRTYYKRLGKPTYRFILSEEIGKISRMSEAEFAEFVNVMGGDVSEILKVIKTESH